MYQAFPSIVSHVFFALTFRKLKSCDVSKITQVVNGGDEVEIQVEFSFILPYLKLCCLNDLEDTHHKIRVITQKYLHL